MVYESGRESSLLDDIIRGDKTVECRLFRGQYVDYQVGDKVWIRRDIYDDTKKIKSFPRQVLVEITSLQKYPTFWNLLNGEGFKKVVPHATTIEQAVEECYRFYTKEEENMHGAIAVRFKVIDDQN